MRELYDDLSGVALRRKKREKELKGDDGDGKKKKKKKKWLIFNLLCVYVNIYN